MNRLAETNNTEHLPWHTALWRQVVMARQAGRLHHALLITGLPGIGKLRFAHNIAQLLFCRDRSSQGQACGVCRGCHLFLSSNHPDLHHLNPEEDSKSGEIKIDAVREMVEAVTLSTQTGGYKVVQVNPADQLNRSAANALLKTLEEPTPSTILILLTAYPTRLLPTIRSRCQHLHLKVPDETMALSWLQTQGVGSEPLLALRLAGGAPLAAMQIMQTDRTQQRQAALDAFLLLGRGKGDPVAITESWLKQDVPLLIEWLSGWVADMAKLHGGQQTVRLTNPDRAEDLARFAGTISNKQLHEYWMRVAMARQRLNTNISPRLMLESLLAYWCRIGVDAGTT